MDWADIKQIVLLVALMRADVLSEGDAVDSFSHAAVLPM